MTLDGYLAIIAILIGLYALAQPIQRRSINIFVSIWLLLISLIFSLIILLWREAVPIFNCCLFCRSWTTYLSKILPFIIPFFALIISIYKWNIAKITKNNDYKFQKFIEASINENQYDELLRIVEKNSFSDNISAITIKLLFDKNIIQNINRWPNWINLSLLSNGNILKQSSDKFELSDNLMRDLIVKEYSILQKYVAHACGGAEYQNYTDAEKKLIDVTLAEPHWYIDLRIDYSLLIFACERLNSGKLDVDYNSNDNLYLNRQGISSRIQCPLYLFIQIHSMMLLGVIEKKLFDRDYYVSDLSQIFIYICDRSNYNKQIWQNQIAILTTPTPYSYLLDLILLNFYQISNDLVNCGDKKCDDFAKTVITSWIVCLWHLSISSNRVSYDFKINSTIHFIDFVLKLKNQANTYNYLDDWCSLIIEKLKYYTISYDSFKDILKDCSNKIDIGKSYIMSNRDWFFNNISK